MLATARLQLYQGPDMMRTCIADNAQCSTMCAPPVCLFTTLRNMVAGAILGRVTGSVACIAWSHLNKQL